MTQPRLSVGIDLGTTHSVVAWMPLVSADAAGQPRVFAIPQLTAPAVVESREVLPSAILLPGPHDLPPDALTLPWQAEPSLAVGSFARERGAELPQRLVVSAKSWLCQSRVDRSQAILPWGAAADSRKLSPVAASAAVLEHIRRAWNHTMAAEEPELGLEHQEIQLTVPASFDPVARELTLRAAAEAGLHRVTLMEEPLAAFYAWVAAHGETWRRQVRVGDRVLVCDVGGGTSDFSLIRVTEDQGELALERVAVGDHLLVGGDNMDLALAHAAARRLAGQGTQLDAWQMRTLWHRSRQAKEQALSEAAGAPIVLTVPGRGSRLIGGTLSVGLEREELRHLLLEGFFPLCAADDRPAGRNTAGLREVGLAYEADPAITRHLAQFLARAGGAPDGASSGGGRSRVLFNGGVMKPAIIRHRLLEALARWSHDASPPPQEIEAGDGDTAVARGGAFYGWSRRLGGIRVRAGLSRAYYIGIAAAMPSVPGIPAPLKALCVAPRGMEEGSSVPATGQELLLVVGETASFDFLGSSLRPADRAGEIIEDWAGEIEPVSTLETTLKGQTGAVVPVSIETRATEVGSLEIWCVARDGPQRWKLEFNLRERNPDALRG
jgi:hypothetical protein